MPVVQPSGVPYFGSLLLLSLIIVCKSSYNDSLKYFLVVHFAHCADQLTQDETTTLETLLNYDQAVDSNTKAQIIVMPRLGTISPWSSKASDILHLCGLGCKIINQVIHLTIRKCQAQGSVSVFKCRFAL
jgi:phosphoribosylformylglycinamidine synthase